MRKLILLAILSSIIASCNYESSKKYLDKIYKPQTTGRPPANAYNGLVMLKNGEIRHYDSKKLDYYISSLDHGLSWDTIHLDNPLNYGKQSSISGEFIRIYSGKNGAVLSARSKGGIDGEWQVNEIDNNFAIMLKPAIFIRKGKRIIVAFHTSKRIGCGTYYSDDDGLSWKKSNLVQTPDHTTGGFHNGTRWNHGAVEPTVIELKDGKLWMVMRTALDQHWESFSTDGGENWSTPTPSRFYGTITMPTIGRLKDGRLLFLWNNSTPLPEINSTDGIWEDVFTNRDVLHAAISEDDGKTWIGFREIYLNPERNDSLFATRNGKMGSLDRSVHQSEFVEPEPGKVLISLGQHPNYRSLLVFDVNWLYEKKRSDHFANDTENWSLQKYIKGIKGHCAYNRKTGAELITHPDYKDKKVLHLRANKDTTLILQNDGAVWNFPSGKKGTFETRIKLNKGFKGVKISLTDRWFNPIDTAAHHFAMFNLDISENGSLNNQSNLRINEWHELMLKWELDENENGTCQLFIDGVLQKNDLPINSRTKNGISNVHFISTANTEDKQGVLIEYVKAEIE